MPQENAPRTQAGSEVTLRCPTCKRRYTVADHQPQRRYKCGECRVYLEAPAAPAAPPRRDPYEGTTVGSFRIGRRLAKGGMGIVYLGEHASTGEKAAVKILPEEYGRTPGIQARFKREGTAGGRLEHPHIVRVLEMDQRDGVTYIATEFVEGRSLEDLVYREKRIPSERAVGILLDVLAGLQHAHDRGVVHRDIKPGNVLVTPEGRGKVIDFGLAMDAQAQTILTLSGSVMGTPSYMSPEQAKGERGGPASDQYSCGLLLYLMLTGRKPFEGKSIVETLGMQVNDPMPSPRLIVPEVSEPLERVLFKMTTKEPSRRYGSPAQAADALRRALQGEEPGVLRRVVFWAWIAAAAVAAAAVAWRLLR